ncbi:MAG: DUF1839 family protein [Planctomycetia bacterium]|nr:DUF1839 family protein [Planctomycetia bacterium]
MSLALQTLNPVDYRRHRLHTQARSWAETNCYVDVLIELLHASGFEPIAALPFPAAIDFEGDQWTFFKFPHADLFDLFGLDVQELALWRPIEQHLDEQIRLGRPVLVELDSYYLPDTAGTTYHVGHQKSTIAAMQIDVAQKRLGYFHGQGYYELRDDDFVDIFHINGLASPAILPPYAEFVKRRVVEVPRGAWLVDASLRLLKRYLTRLPEANPLEKFKPRFAADLEWLAGASLETFHQYSFATLRQFGAAYECTATYLKWLAEHDVVGLEEPIEAFTALSTGAKTLQFQLARAMARKKTLDLAPLDDLAGTWRTAVESLSGRLL